jgi:hypothetical protein
MRNLKNTQIKGLSEFLNTVAATWFSAGVISPLFLSEAFNKVLLLALAEIIMSFFFLGLSLSLLKRYN